MAKAKILLQLDSDPQPSVFDSVVAVDSGVDQLLRHGGVDESQVRDLVHGCMFTRGPKDLASTAIFVGGSNVAAGERLLAAVTASYFGPLRCSVMLDANGANTTASAAVLAARRHVPLSGCTALVLGGTGPVGQRAARLLAGQGAHVRLASRSRARAEQACEEIRQRLADAHLEPVEAGNSVQAAQAAEGAQVLIAAGAAGVELLSAAAFRSASLQVAVDLNAVPPLGIGGLEVTDRAQPRDGTICYGAIGVGGDKMKIHKAAVARLFEANDRVLDAEEIFAIGAEICEPA